MRRSLHFVIWLAAALAVGGYLGLAIRDLRTAGPADPIEAAVLDQASRFATNNPEFAEAYSDSGVALMPGLPLVVSVLIRLFDPHPWEPRVVSLLATLVAAALVAAVVSAETGSATLGAASAGFLLIGQVFATSRPLGGGAGSLLVLLAALGCLALRYVPGWSGAILASMLLGGACFTHPAGLWFAFAALLHLAGSDRHRTVLYAIALAVLVGGGHVLLSQSLGPWFNYSAWDAPLAALRPAPMALVHFLGRELLGVFGVLTLATVLSFALPVRPWSGAVGIWMWFLFAAIASGVVATQSATGSTESLRPAVVALAVVGPLSLRRVTHHLSTWPGSSLLGGHGVVLTAVALQFLVLLAHLTPALLGMNA